MTSLRGEAARLQLLGETLDKIFGGALLGELPQALGDALLGGMLVRLSFLSVFSSFCLRVSVLLWSSLI